MQNCGAARIECSCWLLGVLRLLQVKCKKKESDKKNNRKIHHTTQSENHNKASSDDEATYKTSYQPAQWHTNIKG